MTSSGLAGNGFGATREMSLRKLIWVVTRVHVEVNKYSSWYGKLLFHNNYLYSYFYEIIFFSEISQNKNLIIFLHNMY